MIITNGISQANEVYNSPVAAGKSKTIEEIFSKNNSTVTAEDIIASFKALGVTSVRINEVPGQNRFDNPALGDVNLAMDPAFMQRLIDDPALREEAFKAIQNLIDVYNERIEIYDELRTHDGGITYADGDTRLFSELPTRSLFNIPFDEESIQSLSRLKFTDLIDGHIREYLGLWTLEPGEDSTEAVQGASNPENLNTDIIAKFSRKFAERRGNLLAMQNEMYLLEKAAFAYDEQSIYKIDHIEKM